MNNADWLDPEVVWFVPFDPKNQPLDRYIQPDLHKTIVAINGSYILNQDTFDLITVPYFKNLVFSCCELIRYDLMNAAVKFSNDDNQHYVEELLFSNEHVSTKHTTILFNKLYPNNNNSLMACNNSPLDFYRKLYGHVNKTNELSVLTIYFRILAAIEKDIAEISNVSMFVAEYGFKPDLYTRIKMA